MYVDVLDKSINPIEQFVCLDFVEHFINFLPNLFLGIHFLHLPCVIVQLLHIIVQLFHFFNLGYYTKQTCSI